MADMDEIATLFHIHSQALGHGDLFKNIRDEALEKLKAIDAAHGAARAARATPYEKTALDKALTGTPAAEPPVWAEPTPEEAADALRRI